MTDFTRRQALATGSALAVATMLPRFARAAIPVRLTSVQFGSVSWLIDTIRFEKFDQKHGLDLHEHRRRVDDPARVVRRIY